MSLIKITDLEIALVVLPIPEPVGRGVGFDFGFFAVIKLGFGDFASLYSWSAFRSCLEKIALDIEIVAGLAIFLRAVYLKWQALFFRIYARVHICGSMLPQYQGSVGQFLQSALSTRYLDDTNCTKDIYNE